jgi:heme/copper-type cytochrome/quinol oxidase subunit 4
MKKILLIPLIYFLFMGNAYAYLDPGTGSILLSAIVAVIATIKHYWILIKNFLKEKIFKTISKKK